MPIQYVATLGAVAGIPQMINAVLITCTKPAVMQLAATAPAPLQIMTAKPAPKSIIVTPTIRSGGA